jgi:hypothetical protein
MEEQRNFSLILKLYTRLRLIVIPETLYFLRKNPQCPLNITLIGPQRSCGSRAEHNHYHWQQLWISCRTQPLPLATAVDLLQNTTTATANSCGSRAEHNHCHCQQMWISCRRTQPLPLATAVDLLQKNTSTATANRCGSRAEEHNHCHCQQLNTNSSVVRSLACTLDLPEARLSYFGNEIMISKLRLHSQDMFR